MAYKQDKIREFKYILPENTDVSLFGALRSGLTVRAELRVPHYLKAEKVKLRIHSDGYEGEVKYLTFTLDADGKDGNDDVFSLVFNTEEIAKQLIDGEYGLFYYSYIVKTPSVELRVGGEEPRELSDFTKNGERQLLIYSKNASSSERMKKGIIYHIFVDRFYSSRRCSVKKGAILDPDWENGIPQYAEFPGADVDNNVFFGGDLYGIIEKLPYIASLGVATIYLSPVFEADSNHKYDTADYLSVDSMFGGDEALRELCETAKRYGISVMLDGVFNHTGSDSVYFNKEGNYDSLGAYQSKDSPYYDWYMFREHPDKYDSWWGVKILPRVNSSNEDYLDFICNSVIEKWMNAGVSHWRLDVADELSDKFLSSLREKVSSLSDDAQVIGEVWEDASDKVSYGSRRHYLSSGQLSSVMNYPLRNALIAYINRGDAGALRYATETLYRRYPKHVSDTLMNFLGTHDTERALSVFGDNEYRDLTNEELSLRTLTPEARETAKRKLKQAYAMLCTLPGVPCVFYGDEAGLEGYRDPFCRKPFPWHNIDFDLCDTYRELGNMRKSETLLSDALFEIISLTPEHFAFVRRDVKGEDEILTVVNNTDGMLEYSLGEVMFDCRGNRYEGKLELSPRGYKYLKRHAW